jgi:hypothetical protein
VEQLQPYGRPHADGFYYYLAGAVFEQPLALLNFLSNEDKHRVLIATPTALRSIGWDVTDFRDVAPITDLGTPYFGALEENSPLIEIPVTATGPNPEVEVEFIERARIAVDHRIQVEKGQHIVSETPLLVRQALSQLS